MKNPFNENTQTERFIFFNEMTESINVWMLKKFPEFDNSLLDKIRKIEIMTQQLKNLMKSYDEKVEKEKTNYVDNITIQINEFLTKEYPDLDKSLKMTVKNAEHHLKKLADKIKVMELKQKEIHVYQNLCDDVYKMRDEFKEIQKFIEGFKKKIQKAFDI